MRRFVRDSALRKEISALACSACGAAPPGDPCHVATFGARGLEAFWSMIPMCRKHHDEQGRIGWKRMVAKYAGVEIALRVRGWEFIEAFGKFWLHNPKEKEYDARSKV